MVPLGRPVAVYGLKFLVKAGSPDPVMTRHLCAVDVLLAVTAAGAVPIRSTAGITHPTATAVASEALRRKLRRIGFRSFLALRAESQSV